MIAEKVIGRLESGGKTDKKIDYVHVEWFERDKKLMRKTADSGEEIGIRVSKPLNDGDILYEDSERIVSVDMGKCDLIKITVTDICEMGRLCFEIGNRHLSLSIKSDCVKIPYDAPTFEYLTKLGFKTEKVFEKFTDFTICRGHSHTHEHEHSHSHSHEHEMPDISKYPMHHHCDR